MGKNKHSKDKAYVLQSEWQQSGGYKKDEKARMAYRQLPFDCCALSLQPFHDPVCAPDGTVFDIVNILPYVTKNKKNPVNGGALMPKDLFKLHFHKNQEGQFHCPVTYKPFTPHSHIVAIRTSGNVYLYDAVLELNIKAKNFIDLMTGEKFTKDDIIHIQDPHNFSQRDVNSFDYIKKGESFAVVSEAPSVQIGDNRSDLAEIMNKIGSTNKAGGTFIQSTIKEGAVAPDRQRGDLKERLPISKIRRVQEVADVSKPKTTVPSAGASAAPSVSYVQQGISTGSMALAFTSTALDIVTTQAAKPKTALEVHKEKAARVRKTGKKGYVRLVTTMGDINLELRCDCAPLTCDNFIGLCKKGYYNNTIFHRLIKGFMIQGGDPTGTGKGGESLWGGKFEDEFHPSLTHSGSGVLSMANSGKNTNGSQFFITFKSCPHLDNLHSVFGSVVGGKDILKEIENVPTSSKDKPKTDIVILSTEVFQDPFEEDDEQQRAILEEKARQEDPEHKRKQLLEKDKKDWYSDPVMERPKVQRTGIGKYISDEVQKGVAAMFDYEDDDEVVTRQVEQEQPKRKIPPKSSFGNFDNW